MKLWKSPAFYFGILLVLLVSGAVIAPYVMDWGRYRVGIENFGTQLTGRAVKIEGPISVRLFPWPKLVVDNVKVANLEDASEPDLLTAKRMEIRMNLAGLFSGQTKVETIDEIDPV